MAAVWGGEIGAHLSGAIREVLVPARAFENPRLEQRFLRQFRQSGLSGLILFCLLAAVWAGLILAYELTLAAHPAGTNGLEIAKRIFIALVLVGIASVLLLRPEYAAKYHRWIVVVPLAIVLVMLGGLTLFVLEEIRSKPFRVVGSVSLASVGALACTRSRISEMAPWAILSSVFAAAALWLAGEPKMLVVVIYLIIGNLMGWLLCVSIERRERQLFLQAVELERLSTALAAKAQEADRVGREKEKLIRVVAHDLRQPVASLQLHMARIRLLNGGAAPSSESSPITQANACVTMLQEGVDRLMEPGGAGSAQLRLESSELTPLLYRIHSVYASEDANSEARIRIKTFRQSLPRVKTNEQAMWNVLSNLIGNAYKFQT